MTGITERHRNPAGTWLTMASKPPHLSGKAASPVTIATVRPRALYRHNASAQSRPLSAALPLAGHGVKVSPVSEAKNDRTIFASLPAVTG